MRAQSLRLLATMSEQEELDDDPLGEALDKLEQIEGILSELAKRSDVNGDVKAKITEAWTAATDAADAIDDYVAGEDDDPDEPSDEGDGEGPATEG